jgi:hypothetical protein
MVVVYLKDSDIAFSSRDSAVGIATGYWLDDQGVGVPVKNFYFSMSSKPALGSIQLPIQWVPGVLSPWVKPEGRGFKSR